jgi:hypothetical protein
MCIRDSYSAVICDGSGVFGKENTFEMREYDVIGENDDCVVINDDRFTTLNRKKDKYKIYTAIGQEIISIYVKDSCWGNRITYTLYADRAVKAETIRRHIQAEVDTKFGFFTGSIDLSFIKESEK